MRLHFIQARTTSLAFLLLASVTPAPLSANPVDGVVTAGSAAISTSGSTINISQSSDRAIIDWRGFDIDAGEVTHFAQPSASSVTLNRVSSGGASRIDGRLSANGNIIIVNPNGVLFGAGSHVDVNGLIATTANISNSNFMAGNLQLDQPGSPHATIENRGEITAAEAGLVGLVAPNVLNSGFIHAKLGRIHLASGDSATVDLYGDGLIEVKASDALQSQLVDNTGQLIAEGGTIAMTAAAGRAQVDSLIHVGGELKAPGIASKNGRIYIYAEGSNAVGGNVSGGKGKKSGTSHVVVDGSLDVSNARGSGGKIEVLGDEITLTPTAQLNADGAQGGGTVHVGGQYLGQGSTPTAINTVVQQGARITANAMAPLTGGSTGVNGGEVIVYADNRTVFDGRIEADGIGENGEGGFIETSGRAMLFVNSGTASAAGRRRRGEWLLDPADITITAATTTNNTGTNPYTATGTGSQISAATIVGVLNGNTNVTIQTSNDGFGGNGDITVSSAIITTGSGSLTLSAFRNISVNSVITLQGGSLTLRANNADTNIGRVNVSANITSNNGNITIGGGSNLATGYAWGLSGAVEGVRITSTISAGAGTITIRGRGFDEGAGTTGSNHGILVTGASAQVTGTGTITAVGVGGNSAGNTNAGVLVTSSGRITALGNGTVSVTGTANGNTASSNNNGIHVTGAGSEISSVDGTLTLTGTSLATGTGTLNSGILLISSGLVQTTGSGDVTILNSSGAASGSTGVQSQNHGFSSSGILQTTGGGNIFITNAAGGGGIGNNNYGVNLSGTGGSGIIQTTNGGNITVSANGGSGTGTSAIGLSIFNGARISTGALGGNIAITGTGGANSNSNALGIYVTNASSIITTVDGSIALTGISTIANIGSYGISFALTGNATTTGTGSITVKATANAISFGLNVNNTSYISTVGSSGTRAITVYSDKLALAAANNINAAGILTLAAYTNIGISIGNNVASTLNINNIQLGYLNGAGYVFGTTTTQDGITANTGDVTINTTNDFGTKSVTFVSGNDINIAGTLTKATGAGTANYLFQANRNITFTSAGVVANTGAVNLTINSDFDQATVLGGRVSLAASTIATNGGNITIGGGASPATMNAYSTTGHGVTINASSVITTGAGNISIRGENAGSSGNTGVIHQGTITTTSGAISIYGKSSDNNASGRGIILNGNPASITSDSGNITLTGENISGNSGAYAVLLFNSGTTGAIVSSTSGNITIDASRSSNEVGFGISTLNTATPAVRTTNGSINILADTFYNSSSGTQISAANGTLTFATKTGVTIGVGPSSGNILNIANTFINQTTAANYIFGSTASGSLTVNTTNDFGTKNVTFISGGNISLAGTLTKATGAGTANYLFQANGNISNSASAGVSATTGAINLTLTSDNDVSGAGSITLASAPLTVNGGTITLNSNGQSVTQSGSIGGDETINSLNGAVSISTLNGDTAGTRSLAVNAGTGTFTSTSTIGATNRLNNLTITADDVVLGGNIAGSGTLTLQPTSTTQLININNGAGAFNLSTAEVNFIQDGWSGILLGRSNAAVNAYLDVGAATWNDPVTFRGFVTRIRAALVGQGNAGFTFSGSTSVRAEFIGDTATVTTQNQNVNFNNGYAIQSATSAGNSGIFTNGGAINIINGRIIVVPTNFGTHTISSGGGAITIGNGTLAIVQSGTAGGTLSINSGAATTTFNGTVDMAANLTASAGTFSFNGAWGASTPLNAVSLTSTNALALPSITAASIFAQTTGATSDITIASGRTLTASGAGNAITLASARKFINAASTPFALTGAGRWLVYSTNPAADTLNGRTSNFVRYGCTYGGSCPAGVTIPGSGNGFIYTVRPTLTATPSAIAAITYGDAAPSLSGYGYSITGGYLTSAAGSDSAADSLSGSLTGSTVYAAGSNIGSYNVNYASGTLGSALGYQFSYANNASSITVNTRALSVTADSTSRIYGDVNPAFTGTLTGVYSGDTITATRATPATQGTDIGNYVISNTLVDAGSRLANYLVTNTGGTLSIGQRALTITLTSSVAKTYDGLRDATLQQSNYILSNLYNSDGLTVSNTSSLYDTQNAGLGKTIGVMGLSVAGAKSGNYTLTSSNASGAVGTINQRQLDITADNKTVTYGTAIPAGTLTYNGFIAGEDASYLTTVPTVTAAHSGILGAATYAGDYIGSGGVATNYSFHYIAGDLTVTKKQLNVSADNQAINYGTAIPTGSATYNGFISGDDASNLLSAPTVTSGLSGVVNTGTYTGNYIASGGISNNYSFVYTNGNLTINAVGLNVTAGNRSITYGTVVPTSSYTITGFVNGEDQTALISLPTLNSTLSGIVNANAYADNYVVSGGSATNYTFNYIPADLVVGKKSLDVTADNKTISYGAVVPLGSFTYNGFENSEDASVLDSVPTVSSVRSGIVNSGNYANNYTTSGGTDNNYIFNYIGGALNISKVLLNVVADTKTISYGANVPTGSYSINGFVNSEDATVLSGLPTVSSSLSGIANVGTYGANYTVSSGLAGNYNFQYFSGGLTVDKKLLTVTADNKVITYGAVVPLGSLSYNGFTTGESAYDLATLPTLSSVNSGTLDAGSYANVYIISGAASSNYSFQYVEGNLLVNQRALHVLTNSTSKNVDQANPTFTGSHDLLAADSTQIVWTYGPIGYFGAVGFYSIGATPADPSGRLSNYLRFNQYGVFTVNSAIGAAPVNLTISPVLPNSVVKTTQMSSIASLHSPWAQTLLTSDSTVVSSDAPEPASDLYFSTEANILSVLTMPEAIRLSTELQQILGISNAI